MQDPSKNEPENLASTEDTPLDVLKSDEGEESREGEASPLPSPEDKEPSKDKISKKSELLSERRKEKRFGDLLKPVIQKILSSESISKIIFSLTEDIKELFDCNVVTIYAIDRVKRELFSRNIQFADLDEIRLSISPRSLAGFVAATGKTLNVANAYDKKELSKIHKDLQVDSQWDEKLHYTTKSALVVALAHSKRMMGVLELLNKNNDEPFTEVDVRIAKDLSSTLGNALVKLELEDIEKKLQETAHAIHSAATIDEILLELKTPILQLFDASLITIYAVDSEKNQIFSKIKSGDAISEIRVPISSKSIAGCVAQERRPVNISDVYCSEELKKFHPELAFDSSWDKKSGLKTKSMLVMPFLHDEKLMGVLQLVNKKHLEKFSPFDEKNAYIITDTLALAFFNQQKRAQAKRTKFGYLVENGIISQDELNAAIAKARTGRVDIEDILLRKLKIDRADVGKSLELYFNIPYTPYSDSVVLPPQVFSGLNKHYLAKNNWVPLQNDHEKAVILVDDPSNQVKVGNIKMIFPKKTVEFRIGLKADIRDFLSSALVDDEPGGEPQVTDEMSSLLTELQEEKMESGESSQEDEEVNAISETDSTIVKLVNKILIDAYNEGVSDIHIEPGISKKDVRVRFRKDGACRIYQEIPYLYKQAMLSRLKIMSQLDIAERRLPQDGKIKMKYGRKEIEYRVATCPTVGGNEDAVLRILAASKPIPLDKMNFYPRNEDLIKDKSTKPYGLILVVGPTGSGKTTTLHSCLGFINKPDIKIWTAEDPVEITQDGLRQVQ
ncbi:MAG: ATPase, T2SS/T4P/T4SS family, partial [Nitrospinaceae bacterium]